MPIMDGIEASKKIKERWGDAAPPIVALTAYNTEETKEKCLRSGMKDFLTKPVNAKQLKLVLRRLNILL